MLNKIKLKNVVRSTGQLPSNSVDALITQIAASSSEIAYNASKKFVQPSNVSDIKPSNIDTEKLTSLNTAIDKNKTDINNIKSDISTIQNNVTEITSTVNSLSNTVHSSVENMTSIINEHTTKLNSIDNIENQINEINNNNNSVNERIEEFNNTTTRLTNQINNISDNSGNILMLLSRMTNLENQIKLIKNTNVQVVYLGNLIDMELHDPTVDFICNGTAIPNTTININGKSVDLNNTIIESSSVILSSTGDIELNNVTTTGTLPKSTANASISINSNEYVKITNTNIGQTGYNTLEIGLENTSAPKGILIDNCTFGDIDNNVILIFNTADNAVVTISNCKFGKVSNPIRISNRDNVRMTLNLINCTFEQMETKNLNVRSVILCEDYTAKTAAEAVSANRYGPDKIQVNVINCYNTNNERYTAPADMSSVLGPLSCNDPLVVVFADKGGYVSYDAARYPKVVIS